MPRLANEYSARTQFHINETGKFQQLRRRKSRKQFAVSRGLVESGGHDTARLPDTVAGCLRQLLEVDTLYILPRPGKEDELMILAKDWDADEVGWIGGLKACSLLGMYSKEGGENPRQILCLWWWD